MKGQGWSRRKFLQGTSAGLAAVGITGGSDAAFPGASAALQARPSAALPNQVPGVPFEDLGKLLKSYRVWDAHCHLMRFAGSTTDERVDDCLRFADRMHVEAMLMLNAAPWGGQEPDQPNPENLRKMNDECMRAARRAPGRILGCVFMNPNYVDACLDEINRCVRDGPLVGLKFEFDTPRHPGDQPHLPTYGTQRSLAALDPIAERAGELKAPIMHHTWINTLGPGNVCESTPMEIAELARRHPKTTIICGHTGGNFELGIRGIRGVENCYCGISGSDPIAGFTEMAVRELGAEHVLYGSDIPGRSFASQIAKVMGAEIPDSTRHLVLGGNMRRLMEPILTAKGIKA